MVFKCHCFFILFPGKNCTGSFANYKKKIRVQALFN